MMKLSPTLVICTAAAIVAAGLLTLPPARPSASPAAATVAEDPLATAGAAPVAETPPSIPVDLVIESFAFGPQTLTVRAGGTVRVVNRDSIEHTVTADDGSFDQFVAAGTPATFAVPTTPGTYTFFCRIHPSMTAELIVT